MKRIIMTWYTILLIATTILQFGRTNSEGLDKICEESGDGPVNPDQFFPGLFRTAEEEVIEEHYDPSCKLISYGDGTIRKRWQCDTASTVNGCNSGKNKNSDNNLCCPTCRTTQALYCLQSADDSNYLRLVQATWLEKAQYQFIPNGTCSGVKGDCKEECVQAYGEQYVLAYRYEMYDTEDECITKAESANPPSKYELLNATNFFEVKVAAYCKCSYRNDQINSMASNVRGSFELLYAINSIIISLLIMKLLKK